MRREIVVLLTAAWVASGQKVELATVVSRPVSRTVDLPGEFQPFQSVAIHAKLRGYVEKMLVDRGSVVKQGQLLAELSAPEMQAALLEAESKVQAAEADRLQAEAQLAGAQSTYNRLQEAAKTPGAIAGNEIVLAQKQVEAAEALVRSKRQAGLAVEATVRAQKDLAGYLRITAPFAGVVTERLVHPGALVGPAADPAMLTIEEVSRLRLVVAVPEEDLGGIAAGASVAFRVPAYPDRAYSGTIARSSHSLDAKTRTMAVELDVVNRDGSLAPGMYPSVKWPVRRAKAALFVPKTAVVSTSERTFVVRDRGGHAEWVNVAKGAADGDSVEVSGALQAGDRIVAKATDEIREGAAIAAK
jgi:RND family efflux transporter MFP subunit